MRGPVSIFFFNTDKQSVNELASGFEGNKGSFGNEKEYFAQSLALFRAVVQKQRRTDEQEDNFILPSLKADVKKYDALISMVGFSPQPLHRPINQQS